MLWFQEVDKTHWYLGLERNNVFVCSEESFKQPAQLFPPCFGRTAIVPFQRQQSRVQSLLSINQDEHWQSVFCGSMEVCSMELPINNTSFHEVIPGAKLHAATST